MHKIIDRMHSRLGDLWWYSLMIFLACRSGDVIQAFIGLWLVPKYVGAGQLGAVLPLQQLAGLFTVPLAVIATVFAKFVNTYATRGERGKVKSFIRDVLLASSLIFFVCIAAAYLIIPHFYTRLNVSAGSLTLLILACGLVGNVSSLFSAALQGLKMFRTMTIQNLISAPIRLVTLLVAMPFRALSGYVLGQTTPPASCSLLAALSLRKALRTTPADVSWRKDLPEIWRYLRPIATFTVLGTLLASVNVTVYRQRLPEIESSAYYLITRFAEIAGYIGASMIVVLAPLASEAHESGKENTRLLHKTVWTSLGVSTILAVGFAFCAKPLFSLNGIWATYLPYAYLLPAHTVIAGISTAIGAITTYELSCRRFSVAAACALFGLIDTVVVVCLTGYEFFRGKLPDGIVELMSQAHFASLPTLTWFSLASALLHLALLAWLARRCRRAS